MRSDHRHLTAYQVSCEVGQPIILILRPAILDRHILAFDVPAFADALPECGHKTCSVGGRRAAEEPNYRHRRLLRVRRDRPRGHRASDKRDELPPPHGAYPKAKDHGRSIAGVGVGQWHASDPPRLDCPSRPIAAPDAWPIAATGGVVISIVYVKPIGSEHTADLGNGSNADFQNSKRGVGVGQLFPSLRVQRCNGGSRWRRLAAFFLSAASHRTQPQPRAVRMARAMMTMMRSRLSTTSSTASLIVAISAPRRC